MWVVSLKSELFVFARKKHLEPKTEHKAGKMSKFYLQRMTDLCAPASIQTQKYKIQPLHIQERRWLCWNVSQDIFLNSIGLAPSLALAFGFIHFHQCWGCCICDFPGLIRQVIYILSWFNPGLHSKLNSELIFRRTVVCGSVRKFRLCRLSFHR